MAKRKIINGSTFSYGSSYNAVACIASGDGTNVKWIFVKADV